jgi:putative two-component system response regulator
MNMSHQSSGSADSVLDEIRSTIASFESLRSAASARRKSDPLPEISAAPVLTSPASVPSAGSPEIKARTSFPATSSAVSEILINSVGASGGSSPVTRGVSAAPAETMASRYLRETTNQNNTVQKPAASLPTSLAPAALMPADNLWDDDGTEDILEEVIPTSAATGKPAKSASTAQLTVRSIDKTAKIMIVDDEPLNVMTFRQHLKMEGYENFVTTSNSREALHLLRSERPDVLLLDIRMPDVSGMDILRVVSLDPVLQHTPVLILTAASDPATRNEALELGASDFLQKPIEPEELLPRVRNAIVIKKHYDMASSEAARLEQQVERRTRQLEATRQQLILCLARAAEHRDNDTGNHVIRVGRYTSIIARAMGYPVQKLEMLEQAAQLHDVGKIGIPDSILFKPGKLAHEEYELMKKHCALGKQIIEPISEKEWNILKTHTRIGESMLHVRSSSLLMLAARIAQTHHEHWNGRGYPLGLQGEDIPLEGRIVAVADVFDALSSRRPYKDPFPRQKCFDILSEGRGTQFDPAVIDAFFTCADEIVQVQLLLMDEEDRIPKCEWESVASNALTSN